MNQEEMIPSFDGTKLFMRRDLPNNPKAVIVIAHGLAEHLNRYDALTERLLAADYAVFRYDQRGHARSEGARTFFNEFDELTEDCQTIVAIAKAALPDLPLYLIGHSMGGFTVSLFGIKYPDAVDGIVLSGALTRYTKETFGPLPMAGPATSYIENSLGDGVCSDPAVGEAYVNDPLVEKQISIGLINVLPAGIQWLKDHSTNFVAPVLVLHGANDGLVSEEDSRVFYGEIGSADKTLKIYAKLFHEIFNEPSKQAIYTEVITWLDQQVANKLGGN